LQEASAEELKAIQKLQLHTQLDNDGWNALLLLLLAGGLS
jgi:hypothetical protein